MWSSTSQFPLLPYHLIPSSFLSLSEDTKRPDKPPPILTILPLSERGRSGKIPSPRSEDEILSSPHLKALLFSELKNATRNFRPDGLLGEGGFGCVYKGWLDEQALTAAKPGCGIAVAVKKLKPQGYQGHKEWLVSFSHNPLNPVVYFALHTCSYLVGCSRK